MAPRAKKVIDIALEEAQRFDSGYLGGEHLMLGILTEGDNAAASILTTMAGKDLDRVRDDIMDRLKGGSAVYKH